MIEDSVSATAAPWPSRRYAWYVAILLTIGYAVAVLDRASIALLIEPLKQTHHITDAQFGYLQGFAFSAIYGVLGVPIGILSDRSHRVRILVAGLVVWSAATVGCGLANSFTGLFAARMFVGIGEAALVPVATSLIADYFPPAVRSRPFGLFVAGSAAGTGLAFIMGGIFLGSAAQVMAAMPEVLRPNHEWQVVFMLCGIPGFVLALVILLTMREPRRRGPSRATRKIFSIAELHSLFRAHPRALGGLLGGAIANLICIHAIIGWFPALFIRVHGWSPGQTGWTLGIMMLPISLTAALASGWFIAFLRKRAINDAALWAMVASAVSMAVFATAASIASGASYALLFYILNTCFISWSNTGFFVAIVQITPSHLRGQMVAFQSVANALVAMTVGNGAVGILATHVFTAADGLRWSLAAVLFVCGAGSAALIRWCRRDFLAARTALGDDD